MDEIYDWQTDSLGEGYHPDPHLAETPPYPPNDYPGLEYVYTVVTEGVMTPIYRRTSPREG